MQTGKCACGSVTYSVDGPPMIVHCCHCSDCQRATGSAFVINALIETDRLNVSGELTEHVVETPSGGGQKIMRCADCGTAIYSQYLIRGEGMSFLRCGTMDDRDAFAPDVHIFTSSKRAWVQTSDVPVFENFYKVSEFWSPEMLARRRAVVDE